MPSIPLPTEQSAFSQGSLPYENVPAATPEAFGAMTARAAQGIGQSLENAGNETMQTTLAKQQFTNEASAMSAANQFQQTADDLMNGNADKGIPGYKTLRGKDAMDQQGAYQGKLQDAYSEARDSLNPAAQRVFDGYAHWGLRGAMGSLGDHAAQQTTNYNYTEARGAVDLGVKTALNNADIPDAWNSGLAQIQEASLRSSKIMGLDGDAAEQQRQKDLSGAYEARTRQLEQSNPIAAQKFYEDNIGMFSPEIRYSIERELHQTTTAQYVATDGQTAYANATGRTPAGPVPQNFNADTVKPYSQQQVDGIVSLVKKPSQYDDIINQTAQKYGISPTEIKLRLAAESGFNPNAVSSQGAKGIAQLTDATAKTLGVDPMNPAQAIDGLGRLVVQANSAAGGDRSKVDRFYYGGSTTATGPNTDQYTANLGAVRNSLYGPNAGAPLTADVLEGKRADVEAQARAQAEQRRPGDPVYADQVVAEADKNWARQVQDIRGWDYSNMTTVQDAVIKSGFQSTSELPPELQATYAHLTPQNQLSVNKLYSENTRKANGEYTASDPKVFNDTQRRINLPIGDPERISDPSQITPLISQGLNYTDSQHLITEMKELNSPENNAFMKQVNGVKQTAQKMLNGSVNSIGQMGAAPEAAYRFGFALDQQIATYRKAGKDPQSLFDPSSPDYALKPSRVMAFMPTEAQIVADQAKGLQTQPTGTTPNPFTPNAPAPSTGRPGGVQLTPTASARLRRPGETPAQYLARQSYQPAP